MSRSSAEFSPRRMSSCLATPSSLSAQTPHVSRQETTKRGGGNGQKRLGSGTSLAEALVDPEQVSQHPLVYDDVAHRAKQIGREERHAHGRQHLATVLIVILIVNYKDIGNCEFRKRRSSTSGVRWRPSAKASMKISSPAGFVYLTMKWPVGVGERTCHCAVSGGRSRRALSDLVGESRRTGHADHVDSNTEAPTDRGVHQSECLM